MGTTIELRLNTETGKYEAATVETDGGEGELSAVNPIAKTARFDLAGVPVGAAVVGGITAGTVDVLARMIPNFTIPRVDIPRNVRLAIIFAGAAFLAQVGPVRAALGDEGAVATSLLLLIDSLSELTSFRERIAGIITPPAGTGGTTTTGMNQAQSIAELQRQVQSLQTGNNLQQVPTIAMDRQALAGL